MMPAATAVPMLRHGGLRSRNGETGGQSYASEQHLEF
jgi:hypothetical protein